jgi:hypothetical protein
MVVLCLQNSNLKTDNTGRHVAEVRHMKRPLLLMAAALFFAWLTVAGILGLHDAGSLSGALGHLWTSVRADWMLVAILTDAGVFALLGLVWLWRSARDRGLSKLRRLGWLVVPRALGRGLHLHRLRWISARQGRLPVPDYRMKLSGVGDLCQQKTRC